MTFSEVIRIMSFILFVEFISLFLASCEAIYQNQSNETTVAKNLGKRSIVAFPPDSILQVNVGITLSGRLDNNNAVVVLAFQQNSPLPTEAQPLLFPSSVVTGKQFSVYDHLKNVISSYGFNGTECLRKMVCQVREAPMVGGLLEEVIGFVLSPSRHRGSERDGEVSALLEAERLGENGGDCVNAFPQCVRTPLDFISTLIPH